MGIKSKWKVYVRHVHIDDDPDFNDTSEWELMGETWAVSEDKAVNNVRYRYGYSSQYYSTSGSSWMEYLEWEARPV